MTKPAITALIELLAVLLTLVIVCAYSAGYLSYSRISDQSAKPDQPSPANTTNMIHRHFNEAYHG